MIGVVRIRAAAAVSVRSNIAATSSLKLTPRCFASIASPSSSFTGRTRSGASPSSLSSSPPSASVASAYPNLPSTSRTTKLTRWFSSTATAGAKPAAASANSNVFLDHLGSIFLAGIGLVVVSLVRSYKGSTNRNVARGQLEEQSALDPLEIDDLRLANAELTLDVYREIYRELKCYFMDQDLVLYKDFVRNVRGTMRRLKGEEFTVELGHFIDRIVVDALSKRNQTTAENPQPLSFWMTVLSLALNAPVPDRILALFEVLKTASASTTTNQLGEDNKVTIADIRSMVGYLQETCQLTPDGQVVPIVDRKYPVQQYDRGLVGQLFEWEGPDDEAVDIDAFAAILRSRAVCVWGECYHKRKSV